VMDGFTATARLRENPAWAALPVIAMTANAMAGDRERVLAVGMNDHIAKPLNVAAMFTTIARWVPPRHLRPPRPQGVGGAMLLADAKNPLTAETFALEGIDTHAGLARTLNNPALYKRLLLRFLEGQADFSERCAAALGAGDVHQARFEAHTLKGTAASIGAMGVAAAAEALETACDKEPFAARLAAGLEQVRQQLVPVVAALRARLMAPAPAPIPENALDAAAVWALLGRIQGLVLASDPDAIALGEDVLQACRGQVFEAQARALHAALQGYDFDEAEPLALTLMRQLSQSATPTIHKSS
jgi:two-component system sensor histidine kinase/response regulator